MIFPNRAPIAISADIARRSERNCKTIRVKGSPSNPLRLLRRRPHQCPRLSAYESLRNSSSQNSGGNPEREDDDIQGSCRGSWQASSRSRGRRHHARQLRREDPVPSRHPLRRHPWRLQPRRIFKKARTAAHRGSITIERILFLLLSTPLDECPALLLQFFALLA